MQVSKDPLHGITLKRILEALVDKYGWEGMANHIRVNCFLNNPSLNSSLKFLRKTEWARKKIEQLYIDSFYHNR
ncbi:MAG TPA: VF530 family protein [Arachidicoccus soli]|nr:VF530 family protein [Arachidicoccus soli]